MAVLLSPLQDLTDGTVEVEQLLGHISDLLPVAPVIDAGALDHKEESLLVVQELDGLHRAVLEDGAAVKRGLHLERSEEAEDAALVYLVQVLATVHEGIAAVHHLLHQVSPVLAAAPELDAAAGQEVHAAVHVLGGVDLLVIPVKGMADEVQRGGVVDAAGHGHAGLHPLGLRQVQQAGNGIAVRVCAHISVLGLHARGEGGASRAGVGDQAVGGVGAGETAHGTVVHIEAAAVEHPAAADLLHAHTVAYHHDDVLDPPAFRLGDLHGLVGLGDCVLVVLAELVVGILGTVAGDVLLLIGTLGVCDEAATKRQQKEYKYPLHFHPQLSSSKCTSALSTLQVTVLVSPGRRGKKLSLQKAGATRLPDASRALRMFR